MSDADTTRRVLAEHGLPPGLLPSNPIAVHFDASSGDFDVQLAASVERMITKYPVRYDTRIRGNLQRGAVRRLSGVKVKKGLWLPVSAIEVAGDTLVFAVGPIRKALPASAFGPA